MFAGDTAQMSASTWRQCFNYDYLRRMTAAYTSSVNTCAAPAATTANLGTLAPYWDAYTFAKSGNRTKVVSVRKPATSLASTTHTSTFPDATAARPHAVTSTAKTVGSTGTESFTYDASGNLSKRSTAALVGKTVVFDREGHEKTVTDLATGKVTEYLYDADGDRLIERNATDSSTTLFLASGEVTSKAGARSTVRTYTIDGESVATRDATGVKLMANDRQGTPLISVDATTQTFEKRRYSPYGELLQTPTSWPSTRGFLNKTTDKTDTTHLDAREYDAAGSRFISVDPILDPADPQQMNGYAYANNSPVTSSDPSGLFVPCEGSSCPGGAGSAYQPKSKSYQTRYYAKNVVNSFRRLLPRKAPAAPFSISDWQRRINPAVAWADQAAQASAAAATVQTRAIAGRFAPRSESGRYVSHSSVPWWSKADPRNWSAKPFQSKNFSNWTKVGKFAGPVGLGFVA